MSQENVELLQRLQSEWNDGAPTVDADAYDPEVVFLPARVATEGEYRGLSGIEDFIADTFEVFDKFELHTDLEDLGERVLAWGTIHVRARASGIETDIEVGGLFEFREGRIVRWEDFGSKNKALEAARLSE